ncbi:MAG: hypothetical protein LBE03_00910 [Candidatus Nomurabacteria bacterium]|nr:hypothetical protein [Candidatus Nomurabacteria bacterium]
MQFSRGQVIIPKNRPRKRRARWRWIFKSLGFLGVALGLIGVGATQFYGDIKAESAIKSGLLDKVKSATVDYLGGQPLERLAFALDESNLIKYLSEKIPEIAPDVKIQRAGWLVPDMVVHVSPREPALIWRINGKKYFVDKDGVIFSDNYYQLDPGVEVVDNNNMEVGEKMPKQLLLFLGQITSDIQEVGISINKIVIPTGKTREVDIDVVHGGGVVTFKLSIDRLAMEQVEDMSRVMKHFSKEGVKFDALEYVDIRVKGRAFYK